MHIWGKARQWWFWRKWNYCNCKQTVSDDKINTLVKELLKPLMIWLISTISRKRKSLTLYKRKGKKETKKITWTTAKSTQNIRESPQNIIPNRSNPKPEFCQIVDLIEAWCTFIHDDIIQVIVTCVNNSIKENIDRSRQQKTDDKLCHLL